MGHHKQRRASDRIEKRKRVTTAPMTGADVKAAFAAWEKRRGERVTVARIVGG